MRFIVDTMLGKLARWLRILGYDTLYDPHLSDNELFFKAHLEKRILLTRDKELSERMNPEFCHYVTSLSVREQLKGIIVVYNLNAVNDIFSRCTICNDPVEPVAGIQVKGRVPDYIYKKTKEFYCCKKCDKIYWPGSHIKHVNQILAELNETNQARNRRRK